MSDTQQNEIPPDVEGLAYAISASSGIVGGLVIGGLAALVVRSLSGSRKREKKK